MPSIEDSLPHLGRCFCQNIQYRLSATPIFVNGCHCRDCQSLSGSAFAINIMVEAKHIEVTKGRPINKPAKQPNGSEPHPVAMYCGDCNTLLWATLRQFGEGIVFLRAGTLEQNEKFEPGAHFFTRSKHPWITIPAGVPAYQTMPGPDVDLWDAVAKKRFEDATKQ